MPEIKTTILIVDDSQVIRDLLREYLYELGYTVDVAVDGQDGIDRALAGQYDVVFCDLHMPRKNGFQVYTEVSAAKPQTSFIMTDSLPDELAARAQEAGAYCCITKPFDLEEVQDTLSKVLALAKAKCQNRKTKTSIS